MEMEMFIFKSFLLEVVISETIETEMFLLSDYEIEQFFV